MERILILILVLFSYSEMEACRCVQSKNLKSEFDGTEIVISGKVVEIEILEENHLMKVEFLTERIYKGADIQEKIVIYTPKSTAACGYLEFEIGKNFIVFLSQKKLPPHTFKTDSGKEKFFWTTHCTRTSQYSESLNSELCELLE